MKHERAAWWDTDSCSGSNPDRSSAMPWGSDAQICKADAHDPEKGALAKGDSLERQAKAALVRLRDLQNTRGSIPRQSFLKK